VISGAFIEIDAWAGANIKVEETGVGPPNFWQFDIDYGLGQHASALDVADNMLAWLNDAARPWTPGESFVLTVQDKDPRLGIRFDATTNFDLTPSTGLQSALAWPASLPNSLFIESTSGILSSVAGNWSTWDYLDRQMAKGARSRYGSWAMRVTGMEAKTPKVEGVLDEAQTIALADALALSSSPRRGRIYDSQSDVYRRYSWGKMQRQQASDRLYWLHRPVVLA